MTDLTRGPIGRHLAGMAAFIGAGLVFQAAYFLVDLYFVSRIGPDAVAGVGAAGNFSFLAIAAAQVVSVGSLSLISQAMGRRDTGYANLVFNQACGLSLAMAAAVLVVGYWLAGPAMDGLGADAASAAFGRTYLYGFLPSMAAMFPASAYSSALRAAGVVRPTMLVQSASVLANAILAPVLIAGWGTGHPLGAFGAGLASSVAALGSLAVLAAILPRVQSALRTNRAEVAPRPAIWLSLLRVGLPAAGELFVVFVVIGVTYWCLRGFGPQAQAGYGIGQRIMQALFLPTMAVSFAVAPIAGQNFGAQLPRRVVQAFRQSAVTGTVIMVALTALCQIEPALLARFFTQDAAVLAVAEQFLRVISWNFVGSGLVFACSGIFQAFGDTTPSFWSSASRLFTYAVPAIWLSGRPGIALIDFWHVSLVSLFVQTVLSLTLLRRSFRRNMPAALHLAGEPVQAEPSGARAGVVP